VSLSGCFAAGPDGSLIVTEPHPERLLVAHRGALRAEPCKFGSGQCILQHRAEAGAHERPNGTHDFAGTREARVIATDDSRCDGDSSLQCRQQGQRRKNTIGVTLVKQKRARLLISSSDRLVETIEQDQQSSRSVQKSGTGAGAERVETRDGGT
jgi:hypothetical protein